jgi:sulfur-carrier protein adenylyltransferase/sulfurtransferase
MDKLPSSPRTSAGHVIAACFRTMPAPGSVPSCQEAGVLGVLPGIIGSIQAMETLKLILGKSAASPWVASRFMMHCNSSFRTLKLNRDPKCRLCGDHPDIQSVSNSETLSSASCEISTSHPMDSITTAELRELLDKGFDGMLIDVREPAEHAIATSKAHD